MKDNCSIGAVSIKTLGFVGEILKLKKQVVHTLVIEQAIEIVPPTPFK
jgi:hypothetical protein